MQVGGVVEYPFFKNHIKIVIAFQSFVRFVHSEMQNADCERRSTIDEIAETNDFSNARRAARDRPYWVVFVDTAFSNVAKTKRN